MARILLVDDESSVRDALAGILVGVGHDVTQASDGREAVRLFEHGEFDLIVSDLMMPRMNGFELLSTLRSRLYQRVPFVVISSHSELSSVEALVYAGAYDYLLKPFQAGAVIDLVERALAQRRDWTDGGGDYLGADHAVPAPAVTISGVFTAPAEDLPAGPPAFEKARKVVVARRLTVDPADARRAPWWRRLLGRARARAR